MAIKPMLDDLELQLVQQIEADERQVRAQHAVPALEGDFLQPLGRRAERITLNGILTEDDDKAVGEKLKGLREKFRAAQPVPFAADIATATKIDTVLIEEMSVRELAGKPERFEYAFALREYIPAPPPEEEEPPPPPEPLVTTLIVEVIVEGQPNFDFSKVTVTVDGHKEDGSPHNVTLGQPAGNIWTEEGFPPGSYTARAVVTDPPPMSGSRPVQVLEGQKTQVTIILRPGSTRAIARAFVVHFRFDKAFIEPCMRKVLNEVAAYARGHEQEKMLIVGHTDKSGSDDYNYSLSDRRARSVFAYLNFGNDRAGSLREWNEMRRPSTHSLPSLRDNWGVRQYQYMLEDLGFLPGNVDGDHRDQTDAAVQAFRAAKGLPPGTTVDDAVWEALIEDYHSQEPQAVKPERLLQNANDTGCNGGPLKWLSCGEEMPLPSTPPSPCNPNPGTAWRPNRRTEILFVTETTLPCPVPEPVTFRLDPPGPVGTTWCLGPGNPARRSCFLTRDANDTTRWLVQPMEPGTITVTGSIRRPDGTGMANTSFVLIAPDGEFMNGEHLCDAARGTPNFGVTDANGNFDFSARSPTPVGIYTMEIKLPRGNHVAHLASQPPSTGRGSIVCARLDTRNSVFDVIVFDGAPVPSVVNPSITLARNFVIVKKPHTNPARVQITLRADNPFAGTGTLDRSGNTAAVRLFTADTGGTEIAFDGFDNVFTSAALVAGVTLFAEAGPAPSAAVDDYTLTLTLNPTGTGTTVGAPATAALTAVLFTLDIFLSRPAPAAPPPAMSEADKINVGRHVQFRDPSFTHERTMMTVRRPVPDIPVTLELLPQNGQVQAFTQEAPAGGQAAIPNPQVFAPNSIPAAGSSFFVEGTGASVSTAVRDTGYLLRVQGVVAEVDRVAISTGQLEVTDQESSVSPALTFVRFGLWDQAYDAAGNIKTGTTEPTHFIGTDARKFHFRVHDAAQNGNLNVNWKTLHANRADDDAPASQALTLLENPAGSKVFISRSVMLVTDTTDLNHPTESGLAAPLDIGPRAAGQSNHRTRRAAIDGFMHVEYQAQPGVIFRLTLPLFNRTPRVIIQGTNAIPAGIQAVTPSAMSGTFNNVRWAIRVNSTLSIDTGALQEIVTVTGVTAATFTATFTQAHAAGFRIGVGDERRRIQARVIRYTNPANPAFPVETLPNVAEHFQHVNDRWNTVGIQVDQVDIASVIPRPIPAAALDGAGLYGGSANNVFEQAALADLIPITPDNTLTVVFVAKSGANAYATTFPRNPIPNPAGGTFNLADRHFIFINVGLRPVGDTLAHEMHHVLFNRGDDGVLRQFFTFNTNPSNSFGLPLPDVRVRRRVHNFHTPNPNNDPGLNNVISWARRVRTTRFPISGDLNPAATASTGNRLAEDF